MNKTIIDNSKLNTNSKLYKYMDLEKFLSLVVRKKLCFCNQKKLKEIDPYEGAMTKGELIREEYIKFLYNVAKSNGRFKYIKLIDEEDCYTIDLLEDFKIYNDDAYYVDCWHINNNESLAMWKVFSNNNNSIAISTTKQNLIASINSGTRDIYMKEVEYSDLILKEKIPIDMTRMYLGKDETMYINTSILRGFCEENGLLRKTKYYSYENELRLYFEDINNEDITKFIEVNLDILIDEIIISPNCDEWFLDILNDILGKYNIENKVKYSDIRQNNVYLSNDEKQSIEELIMNYKFQVVEKENE